MDEVNKASEAVRLALEEKDPATRIAGEIAIVAAHPVSARCQS